MLLYSNDSDSDSDSIMVVIKDIKLQLKEWKLKQAENKYEFTTDASISTLTASVVYILPQSGTSVLKIET